MVSRTTAEHKTANGDAYRANVFKNVGGAGTLSLHINNPTDSGVKLIITAIKVTVMGPFTLRRPVDASITDGSATDVANKAVGSTKTTSANAFQDSTYSGESFETVEYLGDDDSIVGENSNAFGGADVDLLGAILEGEDFIIEITNRQASTAADAAITVEYYEVSTD